MDRIDVFLRSSLYCVCVLGATFDSIGISCPFCPSCPDPAPRSATSWLLREAEACAGSGQIGALLRREGLYSSHLTEWRRLRARGAVAALAAKKRGRKSTRDARDRELAKLQRENARLRRQLTQAEAVIEVQKKLSEILGIPLNPPGRDESDE
jgi:hypothetical protein